MERNPYPSDLTDGQWKLVEPMIPPAKHGGRKRSTDMRQTLNAILYVVREGVRWRSLPHEYPPWPSVYRYFRDFKRDGTWQKIHDTLREKVRIQAGKEPTPSAAVIDSQSVKTTEKRGIAADTMRARRSTGASGTSR